MMEDCIVREGTRNTSKVFSGVFVRVLLWFCLSGAVFEAVY